MPVMPKSRTIPDLLDEMADRFPHREALVGRGRRCTYTVLRDEVRIFAKGLHALGVNPGDKVAVLMGNRPEWIIADLAICSLGAVMVAVNTWVTSRELGYILRHSDASMLIASDRFLKYDYFAMLAELEPLQQTLPLLRSIVHIGARSHHGSVPFEDVCQRGRAQSEAVLEAARRAIDPKDVAYLLYTSGSTSMPKGVQLQHFALIENMWQIGERMHVTERDRLWLAGIAVLGARLRECPFQCAVSWRLCGPARTLRPGRSTTPHQLRALHAVLRDAQHGAGAFRPSPPTQL